MCSHQSSTQIKFQSIDSQIITSTIGVRSSSGCTIRLLQVKIEEVDTNLFLSLLNLCLRLGYVMCIVIPDKLLYYMLEWYNRNLVHCYRIRLNLSL